MMMMLSLHLKASNQPANQLASQRYIASWIDIHWIIYVYIQRSAIYAATVTAILNAEHATGISKSESETHIHFYMITSLNNFLSFSFSVALPCSLFLSLSFAWVILPFDCCRNFFLCVAFFIRWIAKAESNRMNTKFTFGRETHTRAHKWLFSRANERKTKTKRKNIHSCTFTKSAGNHTQHTNDMNCKITP